MTSRSKPMKAKPVQRDFKKESVFKDLSQILEGAGYVVRREKLKQGHGWKVVSGTCTAQGSNLVFVDRRMSQDDQISFLLARIGQLNVPVPQEKLAALPEVIAKQLAEAGHGLEHDVAEYTEAAAV